MIHYLSSSTAFVLSSLVLVSFMLQRLYRRTLSKERYFYMRDLTLVGVWMLFALWTGDSEIRAVVGMALLGSIVGMVQHTSPNKKLSWLFGVVGFFFALVGPRISFVGMPGGQYLYLSSYSSILMTALWVTVFPLLFQRLDDIPGLAGHLLGVSFSLTLLISSISGQQLGDAFLMSIAGVSFVAVFWSRLGHNYRQLGKPLSSFWGMLVAGASLVGVTKGVTFTTLMVIPMGLYALPMMELSLYLVSHAVPLGKWGNVSIYHRMMDRGVDHPGAVKFVTFLCLLIGTVVSFVQIGINDTTRPAFLSLLAVSIAVVVSCLKGSQGRARTGLWGIRVDGMSMNYALSKVRGRFLSGAPSAMIVTANALSFYRAKKDPLYREIADSAWLTLPDGAGLVWALKFLGVPVVERVAGIDFMHGLCRLAAVERWPIYLLGSKPDVVSSAAVELERLYPGLKVVGYRDGYFDDLEDQDILQGIRSSGAKLLFTALGVPKQEAWLNRYLPEMDGVVGVGVGGSFDVISGRLRRAPLLWQKCGLEWLYRLIQEPWRLRQDVDLVLFVFSVLLEKIGFSGWRGKDENHRS